MSKRFLFLVSSLTVLMLATAVFAKPKEKIYNNTVDQVFQAALRTAREKHVVTYVDDKHYMLTFETGTSLMSYGFNANASVEDGGGGKAKLVINVQKKNDAKSASWSMGAGDRMADKFFEQVGEELALMSSQKIAVKPEAPHVDVPPSAQMAGAPAAVQGATTSETGIVELSSTPDSAEVSVDGNFVGNAPATLKLPSGKHTITVTADGFKTWTKEVGIFVGSSVKLNAKLEKNQ